MNIIKVKNLKVTFINWIDNQFNQKSNQLFKQIIFKHTLHCLYNYGDWFNLKWLRFSIKMQEIQKDFSFFWQNTDQITKIKKHDVLRNIVYGKNERKFISFQYRKFGSSLYIILTFRTLTIDIEISEGTCEGVIDLKIHVPLKCKSKWFVFSFFLMKT